MLCFYLDSGRWFSLVLLLLLHKQESVAVVYNRRMLVNPGFVMGTLFTSPALLPVIRAMLFS